MGLSLYEIDRQIMALVDPETGEIMDGASFDQLKMAREDKLEGIACFIKNTVAEAAAIKAEEAALAARRKVLENRATRLKTYLQEALGGEKFQTARCSVTFRSSTGVEIIDEDVLLRYLERNGLEDCIKYKAPEIGKAEVGKLLKEGRDVPGAILAERQNIQIK